MQLIHKLRRFWNRLAFAGADYIYDYELAALHCLLSALTSAHSEILKAQLIRYDRIDRSPNGRFQRFVDDDSDSERSSWPQHILFEGLGTAHVVDIVMHLADGSAKMRARGFMVSGIFDGFEFFPEGTRGVRFEEFRVDRAMQDLGSIATRWDCESVRLFHPFGANESSIRFDEVTQQ